MDETNEALFQRIREKCQRNHWYGADMDDPHEKQRWVQEADTNSHVAYYWYDQEGQQHRIDKDADLSKFPLMNNFAYPQATETDVAITEQALGFTLPPLLRQLYTQVANGGFGPGYGLNGVIGGFGNILPASYLSTKRQYRLVDIGMYERRQAATQLLELPVYVFPDRVLELCHWGCAIYSYLDCTTGRIFRGEYYRNASDFNPSYPYDFYGFKYEADSLLEWLELWSKDQLEF